MIVKSVRVCNFRSVRDETLYCDSLTALVGANGAGKSTFLHALEMFYSSSPSISNEDFYNHDATREIEIAITFTDLLPKEEERFQSRMTGPDLLVMRVFSAGGGKNSGRYYGFTMSNPEFQPIRATSGRDFINLYNGMSERLGTPKVRSQADAEAQLQAWEEAHPEQLQLGRDDGQFFGFTNVARGYLGDLTRFLFIPAVKDAADDASEGRSSAITALMDLVVRATLSSRTELVELKAEMQRRYNEITDPERLPELGQLAGRLTNTLKQYYTDAAVSIDWLRGDEINLPPPRADVRVVEEQLKLPVSRMGHGLQRAFILTLLQHLAVASAAAARKEADSENAEGGQAAPLNLILGIEEPELYQHPSRQRHFARVLLELASGAIPGVASRTQVFYATHSALMVDVERFNQVRRVTRKRADEDGDPKVTAVVGTSWSRVADVLWEADGRPEPRYTEQSLKARISTLMTPWMNEGFFADMAVLVEGEDDRSALLGVAKLKGVELEGIGCTIIPCGGKQNIDRPSVVFRELGIPTYLIWDGDANFAPESSDGQQSIKANRRLLHLCGGTPEDSPNGVYDDYACFRVNLEKTMEDEIGKELFAELLAEQQSRLTILKKSHALKNPDVIAAVLKAAAERGSACAFVEEVVARILRKAQALSEQPTTPLIAGAAAGQL